MQRMNMMVVAPSYSDIGNTLTDWSITNVTNAEDAIEKMHQISFDMIAVSVAMSDADKAKLKAITILQQEVAIIILYDKMEEIIANAMKIMTSIKEAAKPVYSFIDNGFRNHSLYVNDNNI